MVKKKQSPIEVDVFIDEPLQKGAPLGKRLDGGNSVSVTFYSLGGMELEKPPFSIDDWAIAPEISTRLAACVQIRATNAAGLGYELEPKKRYKRIIERSRKEMTEDEKKQLEELKRNIEDESQLIEDFLDDPHPTMPFSVILKEVIGDREVIGNGYLAVHRSLTKTTKDGDYLPIGLERIVGQTVRIKKKGGFVAIDKNRKVTHFKDWGDKDVVDKNTGIKTSGLTKPELIARELIHFKVAGYRESSYGIPRHLSTAPAIAGSRFAGERNSTFFENDATPRIAIVVSGPYRLSKESREDIKEFLERKGKGTKNTGRIMIIQAGTREGSMTEKEDVKIEFHKLTVGIAEDAGYLKYQDRNDGEISEVFGLHPVFFASDITRAGGSVGRSITNDQTFEPDIAEIEFILNKTLMRAMGIKILWLKLVRPKKTDFEGLATIYKKMERTGGITPNDIRDYLGKPRFTENWADMPLPLVMQGMKVPADRAKDSSIIDSLMSLNNTLEKAIGERQDIGESLYDLEI